MIYSVSAPPCHLLSKYKIKLNKPRLTITRMRSSNSCVVRVTVVFMISAPIKNSKLRVRYPERNLVTQDGL